jgi:hypothetical protein
MPLAGGTRAEATQKGVVKIRAMAIAPGKVQRLDRRLAAHFGKI